MEYYGDGFVGLFHLFLNRDGLKGLPVPKQWKRTFLIGRMQILYSLSFGYKFSLLSAFINAHRFWLPNYELVVDREVIYCLPRFSTISMMTGRYTQIIETFL